MTAWHLGQRGMFHNISQWLLGLPRIHKRLLLGTADAIALPVAFVLSAILTQNSAIASGIAEPSIWLTAMVLPLFGLPILMRLGLYRSVLRYMGGRAVYTVLAGTTLTLLLTTIFILLMSWPQNMATLVVFWFVATAWVSGSRMLARDALLKTTESTRSRVLIYGAGAAGTQLASALARSPELEVVGFVDDDPALQAHTILGVQVYAPEQLPELIKPLAVQEMLLALPSLGRHERQCVLQQVQHYPVHVRTIPGLADIVSGKAKIDELQEVDIGDLLGRPPVPPDEALLDACIREQVVVVTGAGGSIGSELCRQIARLQPQKLILFERSEIALYEIERELKTLHADLEIESVLGTVLDAGAMTALFKSHCVATVYHAAAYKHVPLVEANVTAGVQNNVLGTWYTAQAAVAAGVSNFVLISTDKAVRPTNVMGASKRMAELALQALASIESPTRFCMVRFGNVLGSSGSVVPLFRQQIQSGGPVTVTHPDVTRYFMTIPEAAQLVIQAGSMGQGGDVFLLEMGEPVRITDLAKKMIHLSGLQIKTDGQPNGDIEIVYAGLRPGEKMTEELLIGNHEVTGTGHAKIMRAKEQFIAFDEFEVLIQRLHAMIRQQDAQVVCELLLEHVEGYSPAEHASAVGQRLAVPVGHSDAINTDNVVVLNR